MGFGSKSRKQAQQQQLEAQRQQNAQFQEAMRVANEYRNSHSTRNAPIIAMQGNAQNWLERFNKGADVASLNPAFARYAQDTSDQVVKTMQFASQLGDRQEGDADYQAKLNSVATRNIAKGLARINEEGLMSELNSQRGILMDTTNFLNSDSRASFSMQGDLFGMTNSIFANATTRRQMEMQRSNMMMQNLMGFISGGIQGAASVVTGGVSNGGRWAS